MRLVREGVLTHDAMRIAEERLNVLIRAWNEVTPTEACRRLACRMLRVHPLRAADAIQLAAATVAAENDPATLDIVCLDARLSGAARIEGYKVIG
jgi:hypothetical protein